MPIPNHEFQLCLKMHQRANDISFHKAAIYAADFLLRILLQAIGYADGIGAKYCKRRWFHARESSVSTLLG